jgi:hypothetical protein
VSGWFIDFELTAANRTDLEAGFELLSIHTGLEVLGDKGYIRAPKAAELWEKNRIRLRTIPRSNQKEQVSDTFKHQHNAIRQLIETVNGQLQGQVIMPILLGACVPVFTASWPSILCVYISIG